MLGDRRPDEREWRIRVRLAEAHLRGAEAGAFDAAVTTLLQAMVGKDAEGRALEVPMATRVEAAVALLRHAKDVSTLLSGYLGPMPDLPKSVQRRLTRAARKPERPP